MFVLGATLLLVGFVLLLAEAHMSAGGLIAAGACVAGVAGVVLLLTAAGAGAAVVLVVALCAIVLATSAGLLWRRRVLHPLRTRPRTGREALVGDVGVVRSGGGPEAQVFVNGSLWRAEPDLGVEDTELSAGEKVVVERVNGLTLRVRKAEEWELSP